jgi:hypothetical protein
LLPSAFVTDTDWLNVARPLSIGPSGEVLGTVEIPGEGKDDAPPLRRAAIWQAGRLRVLPAPVSDHGRRVADRFCYAMAADTAGNIYGASGEGGSGAITFSRFDAIRWSAGGNRMERAPSYSGRACAAWLAVNHRGEAVGFAGPGNASNLFALRNARVRQTGDPLAAEEADYTLALYRSATGRVIRLPGGGTASAINDKGVVVGTYGKRVIWWDAAHRRHSLGYGEATAINNSRVIVGWRELEGTKGMPPAWHATRWAVNHTQQDLGTLPGCLSSRALAINDSGIIVGDSARETGDAAPDSRACLWREGRVYDLNALTNARSGWTLRHAYAIDGAGRIAGAAERDGEFRAVLLTPVR